MKSIETYKTFQNWKGYSLILVVLVCLIALYGCEDFLTTTPKGELDEFTLANEEGIEGTLIGAYRVLGGWTSGLGTDWSAASSNWIYGSAASDDASKGSDPPDVPHINDIELYRWGGSGAETALNGKWRSQFEGVVRSNATLRLLSSFIEDNPEGLPEVQVNSIRGEALFLRAHFHFEAWKLWENIPYLFEDDEVTVKSNEGVDVIGKIIDDLQQAITYLPDQHRNGEVGRVTSWTARAYLGRVQIYAGDYSAGLTTLREVRNEGPFELEENYHRVWTGFVEYANGPETILAYQASANDGDTAGNNANYGDRLNFPHSGSPFDCCGFHQPTQNLVNFFTVDNDGLPLALSSPNGWNNRNENLTADDTDVPVDPRLDWTVGRDHVPYLDWGPRLPGWVRDRSHGGPYSPKKNVHEDASNAVGTVGWTPAQTNSVNIHLFRYADALLLLAEAEVEEGSLENAREIVNEIRTRAGVAAQGPGDSIDNIAVPIDDPSITWANYQIGLYEDTWTDQGLARTAVRHERRLELAMEGHRLFDLRRWGIAAEVLNEFVEQEIPRYSYLQNAALFEERHDRYPIPTIQIELSNDQGEGSLIQNPGW
jgi:starch-binding outer membrane protein, SusD/RagB family